ncbi:MAG: Mrp/NBP35 family ATP-binding protein [Lachnospiraceae bacterium]|nr:Mrp/NBP35 family ATP-binding protein [Lachnospiraceae bacterium]
MPEHTNDAAEKALQEALENLKAQGLASDESIKEATEQGDSQAAGQKADAFAEFRKNENERSHIRKIIGVVSGKGGVGKTLVTSMLASEMQRRDFKTGIIDADITGPSIPRAFDVTEKAMTDGTYIFPGESKTGIKIISMNMLLDNASDPVVWRGPVIASTVTQFYTDVAWGLIDYLFVDMPPGTGDVPLTVFQSLPVDGIIVVTSPQELVSMIVEKAVKMAEMMNVPILGIVENMSYFECPDCGKRHAIFGESHIEELAERYGISAISRIPIDPKIAALSDAGKIEAYYGKPIKEVADKLESLK